MTQAPESNALPPEIGRAIDAVIDAARDSFEPLVFTRAALEAAIKRYYREGYEAAILRYGKQVEPWQKTARDLQTELDKSRSL